MLIITFQLWESVAKHGNINYGYKVGNAFKLTILKVKLGWQEWEVEAGGGEGQVKTLIFLSDKLSNQEILTLVNETWDRG